MQDGELCAHRCSGIINWTSQLDYEYILNIGTAGLTTTYDSAACPATTRSRSVRSRARGDLLHDSTETKNENEDIDPALGIRPHDLPEWLEEFTENLLDEGVAASRDTTQNPKTKYK